MKILFPGIRRGAAWTTVLLMSACAWLPDKAATPAQETDYAKVNAIEALARARGVSVYWYRFPTKPVEQAAAATGEPPPRN